MKVKIVRDGILIDVCCEIPDAEAIELIRNGIAVPVRRPIERSVLVPPESTILGRDTLHVCGT